VLSFSLPVTGDKKGGVQQSRRVHVAGITRHPDQAWMERIGRTATQDTWGYLHPCRYVLHDRDSKFCASFRATLTSGGVKPIQLPAQSPNINAFAERWVRSIKQECLSKLILFGEASLWRVLTEYSRHYHGERNHQGKGNQLLFPEQGDRRIEQNRAIECRKRLGGLLKYYRCAA
jgi:putative transposase